MSGSFAYNHRPSYGGGPIAKKQRLQPTRMHHASGNPQGDDAEPNRLKSFKEYIINMLPNDINEQDALKRYGEYKAEFTRRQISAFFREHQEEEWFRNKYRPADMKKIEEATKESKNKRRELYNQLIESKIIGDFSIDFHHENELSRFLDYFSLLLEGASIDELANGEASKKYAISSIYNASLHTSIEKSTIEEFASSHSGFLRVAMSEAQYDRNQSTPRLIRKAWISYKYMEPELLRQLCWEYNHHRFSGQEARFVVNRELNNRIRKSNPWFCHEKATKADLKNVAKLLTHFEGEDCAMLESIKEHLIEETNEEEQILGVNDQNQNEFEFKQDINLLKALDKVILYLRVVHSYDYYASTEHIGEDDMPLKVGVMFARQAHSQAHDYGENPQDALQDLIDAQRAIIDAFLEKPTLSESELRQLGKRDADIDIKDFIYSNTLEKRGKKCKKFVCGLTNKKFTAPEFVEKHIFNRCGDRLDEIRAEVEFFNNYLADAKRPM